MTRLAVFFDGTWNTPNDRTNVYKLYKLVNDIDLSQQQAIYIQGVGSGDSGGLVASFKHFLGGAFGDGLSENIIKGYRWLADTYRPGDDIFLFGFSRGAYSARSLSGMIRNCGILRKNQVDQADEAYNLYRDHLPPDSDAAREFRRRFAMDVPVAFVGVWDTVGSLGIPVDGLSLPGFKEHYKFHDTKLSQNVKAAYHALAANEYRSAYGPTLWTRNDTGTQQRSAELPVEQRWFIGAHANVGGGYVGDTLCSISCRWIQKMAQKHGLGFLADWPVEDDDSRVDPRDSYTEFVTEHPGTTAVIKRQPRAVGLPISLNETIDRSLLARIKDASFLPQDPQLKTALQQLALGLL
jgi:uncharacterized protein (DUF2235 family)